MTGVLLLAHGSREAEAGRVMEGIAERVRAILPGYLVETASLQFGGRGLEQGLEKLERAGAREIRVIPYFLFEGVHVRRLESVLRAYEQEHPALTVRLGRALGEDPRLAAILADRVLELEHGA